MISAKKIGFSNPSIYRLVTASIIGLVFSHGVFAAEVPFPATPILDNFNRSDEPSPGGSEWIASLSPQFPGHLGFSVINGKATSTSLTESASSSWTTMFPQDQEAYFQYGDTPGTKAGMGPAVRLKDPSDLQSDQYIVFFYQRSERNYSEVRIWKRFAGAWTSLTFDSINDDLVAGDQIGIRAVGSRVDAYLNGDIVSTYVDPQPILGPGYAQLYVGDDVGHTADNFGAGPVQSSRSNATPALSLPTSGSVLAGSSQAFQWTSGGAQVSQWWLQAGTAQGLHDIANLDQGRALSTTLTGLPTDGSDVWVRLWYVMDGSWHSRDYQFTAATTNGSAPVLSLPSPGSALAGSSAAFQWAANGVQVSQWWLQVGTAQGEYDIANLNQRSALSTTLTGLPVDGSDVWVRLWYRIGDNWLSRDYQYSAATTSGSAPVLNQPSPGSALAGSSATFQWAANGVQVSQWWLQVGTTQGEYDIANLDQRGALSTTLTGLPVDGSTVWVRLWYLVGGSWLSRDYRYMASTVDP